MVKKTTKIDMSDLQYYRPSKVLESDTQYALRPPVKYEPGKVKVNIGFFLPVRLQEDLLRLYPTLIPPDIIRLAQIIGLDTEEEIKYLRAHEQHLKRYSRLWSIIAPVVYILVYGIGFVAGIYSVARLLTEDLYILLLVLSIIALAAMLGLIIAQRLSSAILDRHYADTLAFASCLNLCILLSLGDTLLLPGDRSFVLKRSQGLRKFLTLLSYRYNTTRSGSVEEAHEHFKKMEYYIMNIERQILIPNSRTQQKLRNELFTFARILLTAQYGKFKYKKKIPVSKEKAESTSRRILNGVLRIIGMAIPLILFLGLLFYPDRFEFLGAYNNIVALVSLAWLLLAIDTALNLGVVDRISTLATAIKELK